MSDNSQVSSRTIFESYNQKKMIAQIRQTLNMQQLRKTISSRRNPSPGPTGVFSKTLCPITCNLQAQNKSVSPSRQILNKSNSTTILQNNTNLSYRQDKSTSSRCYTPISQRKSSNASMCDNTQTWQTKSDPKKYTSRELSPQVSILQSYRSSFINSNQNIEIQGTYPQQIKIVGSISQYLEESPQKQSKRQPTPTILAMVNKRSHLIKQIMGKQCQSSNNSIKDKLSQIRYAAKIQIYNVPSEETARQPSIPYTEQQQQQQLLQQQQQDAVQQIPTKYLTDGVKNFLNRPMSSLIKVEKQANFESQRAKTSNVIKIDQSSFQEKANQTQMEESSNESFLSPARSDQQLQTPFNMKNDEISSFNDVQKSSGRAKSAHYSYTVYSKRNNTNSKNQESSTSQKNVESQFSRKVIPDDNFSDDAGSLQSWKKHTLGDLEGNIVPSLADMQHEEENNLYERVQQALTKSLTCKKIPFLPKKKVKTISPQKNKQPIIQSAKKALGWSTTAVF